MFPPGTHDLKTVLLVLGGFDIAANGEDGKIAVTWNADLFEKATGSTGDKVYSRINDDEAVVTIDVLQTSRAYHYLATLMQAQLAAVEAGLPIPPLPFLLRHLITGDKVSDGYAVFMKRPELTMAKGQTNRTFEISLPNAGKAAEFGTSIL